MTSNRAIGCMVALIVLFGSQYRGVNTNGYVFAQNQLPPMPDQEQIEVLTSGPVHEAFAEPVNLQTQTGLAAPHQPPADIEEIPPTDRPQDDRFVWIPGYWGWDADRDDFIWVSACWRMGPPNMYWVPGYWTQVIDVQEVDRAGVDVRVGGLDVRVGGGTKAVETVSWEWVSGFWRQSDTREIEYLPAPPAPMDLEPPGPPPTADNMWVPGCWYWDQGQYVRRPGYWLRQQSDWIWSPSHYRWTPRGYVFERGHWDYSLERRGVLFAPVYFPRSVYARPGYTYSPSIAIDIGVLTANLFIYPRYGHYYFGDYYDDAYRTRGIYPQFERERIHTWYDPIYTYDRWHHGRTDKRWEENQRREYDQRRSDKNLRPAHTYREMESRAANMPNTQRRDFELAKPLKTIVQRKSSPMKFKQIKPDAQQKIARQATDVQKFRQERVKWETTGSTDSKATVRPPVEHKDTVISPRESKEPVTSHEEHKGSVVTPDETRPRSVSSREVRVTRPERVKIPSSPIVGKPKSWISTEKGPPPRPADEQEHKAKVKDARKDKNKGKDKDKDKDNKN